MAGNTGWFIVGIGALIVMVLDAAKTVKASTNPPGTTPLPTTNPPPGGSSQPPTNGGGDPGGGPATAPPSGSSGGDPFDFPVGDPYFNESYDVWLPMASGNPQYIGNLLEGPVCYNGQCWEAVLVPGAESAQYKVISVDQLLQGAG